MSADPGKLVVTYILPREEDPTVFDHLAGFRKGPSRTGRLKTLVRNGLLFERIDAFRVGRARESSSEMAPRVRDADDADPAVMDQIFASVER